MGRIGVPFGVQGWVRIQTYSEDPDTLLDFDRWWVRQAARSALRPGAPAVAEGEWREIEVLEAQAHGGGLIAQLKGIGDRDQAERARGTEVGLFRSELPEPEAGEFYWEDLIGIDAVDHEGNKVGVVSGLLESGAHDVLVIDTPLKTAAGRPHQILVPFVERHVGEIDLGKRQVVVDWEEPV